MENQLLVKARSLEQNQPSFDLDLTQLLSTNQPTKVDLEFICRVIVQAYDPPIKNFIQLQEIAL